MPDALIETFARLVSVPQFRLDEWAWAGLGLAMVIGAVWWHLAAASWPKSTERRRGRLLTTLLACCIAASFATPDLVTYLLALEGVGLVMLFLIGTWCPATAAIYFTAQMFGLAFFLVGAADAHFAGGGVTFGPGTSFLLLGLAVKAGMIGGHLWIPVVYSRVPVLFGALPSTLALCVPIVGLVRFVESPPPIVVWVGLATALYGAIRAMQSTDLRLWSAYAAISWTGGMVLAWSGCPSTMGAQAVLLIIGAHACAKTAMLAVLAAADRQRENSPQTIAGPDPLPSDDAQTIVWRSLQKAIVGCFSKSGGLLSLAAFTSIAGLPPSVEFMAKQQVTEGFSGSAGLYLFGWAGALSVGYALRGLWFLRQNSVTPVDLPRPLALSLIAFIFAGDQWLRLGSWWLEFPTMAVSRLQGCDKAIVALTIGPLIVMLLSRLGNATASRPRAIITAIAVWTQRSADFFGEAHLGRFRLHLMIALATGLAFLFF